MQRTRRDRCFRCCERSDGSAAHARKGLAGDPPLGVALLTFRPSVSTGAPIATLEDLYVGRHHRGRGHGRSLLREALGVARQRGAASVELYTGEGDAAARALYEAHGLTNTEPGDTDRLLFYHRRL